MLDWVLGPRWDHRAILIAALSTASLAETLSPVADACNASGLIALSRSTSTAPRQRKGSSDMCSDKVSRFVQDAAPLRAFPSEAELLPT
jgi:hypothetical protein